MQKNKITSLTLVCNVRNAKFYASPKPFKTTYLVSALTAPSSPEFSCSLPGRGRPGRPGRRWRADEAAAPTALKACLTRLLTLGLRLGTLLKSTSIRSSAPSRNDDGLVKWSTSGNPRGTSSSSSSLAMEAEAPPRPEKKISRTARTRRTTMTMDRITMSQCARSMMRVS